MKKILYSLIVIMAATFTACEDPGSALLYAEEYLELDAATTVTGSRTYNYLRVNDGVGLPSGFVVNLGAAQSSSPINFTFEIDVANSTAIENLHFTVDATTGTIPANSSTAELPITILDDNINPGEAPTVVINLTGGDIAVNPNYQTATHVLQVLCESNLGGMYTMVTTYHRHDFLPTFDTNTQDVELVDEGDGVYSITGFDGGLYAAGNPYNTSYGTSALTNKIQDVCGAITTDGASDPWQQLNADPDRPNSYDAGTGVITFSVVGSVYGENWTSVLTPK